MARRKKVEEIVVKVARTGTRLEEVALDGGHTVEDALMAAEITPKETEEVRINGEPAELDDELEDGDRVILVKNISGGKA